MKHHFADRSEFTARAVIRTRAILTLLLVALLGTSPLAAQRSIGVWGELGIGYGVRDCAQCARSEGGISGHGSLNFRGDPHWTFGLGATTWASSTPTQFLVMMDARTRVYPSKRAGFFMSGGLGVGWDLRDHSGDRGTDVVGGAGWSLGVGWDLNFLGPVSFTPYASVLSLGGRGVSDSRLIHGGVALTF